MGAKRNLVVLSLVSVVVASGAAMNMAFGGDSSLSTNKVGVTSDNVEWKVTKTVNRAEMAAKTLSPTTVAEALDPSPADTASTDAPTAGTSRELIAEAVKYHLAQVSDSESPSDEALKGLNVSYHSDDLVIVSDGDYPGTVTFSEPQGYAGQLLQIHTEKGGQESAVSRADNDHAARYSRVGGGSISVVTRFGKTKLSWEKLNENWEEVPESDYFSYAQDLQVSPWAEDIEIGGAVSTALVTASLEALPSDATRQKLRNNTVLQNTPSIGRQDNGSNECTTESLTSSLPYATFGTSLEHCDMRITDTVSGGMVSSYQASRTWREKVAVRRAVGSSWHEHVGEPRQLRHQFLVDAKAGEVPHWDDVAHIYFCEETSTPFRSERCATLSPRT